MNGNKKFLITAVLISGLLSYFFSVYNVFIERLTAEKENGEIISYQKEVKYPVETLNSLPVNELYDIFVENGLDVSEVMEIFNNDKDEFIEYFGSEFELLSEGLTSRSDMRYFELAEQVKVIYDSIVIEGDN
ncbi:MAG: hypothetical protein R3Y29_08000 [bacterium]